MRPTSLRANDCATPGAEQFPPPSPKSQTTSPTTTHCQHLSPRRSALWAPHHLESQPHRHPAGELHYMRVRHAGDTLCDYLVSCKPPPLPAWRAHAAYKTGRSAGWRKNTRPTRGFQRPLREKTRPTHLKTAFFTHYKPAGRAFSCLNETATAFASSFTGAHETSDAFARPQCPKIKHFARAKVPAVSPHHEDRAAMVPPVSARPHAAPNRQAMHRLTHHCTSY